MSRDISRGFVGSLLILAVASLQAASAEKTAKESGATAAARKQVETALRAEAAGDNTRRADLLKTAVETAPALSEANWHLARVRVGDQWLSLADAEQHASSDPLLAEYRKLRDEAGDNSKLIRGLARWCLKNGLEDSARLHYAQLLNHSDVDADAKQEAIRRMGLHNIGGSWLTAEQVKAQEERTRSIDAALRQWRPRLKRIQIAVDSDDFTARERAIKELSEIDDPRAIIALESFQIDGGDRFCEEAVKRLTKFQQIEGTEALVRFALLTSYSAARNAAADELKRRPKHDFVPMLLSGLTEPIKSQFSVAVSRGGVVQYTHAIQQENANQRVVNVSSQTAVPFVYRMRYGVYQPGVTDRAFVTTQVMAAEEALFENELARQSTNFQLTEGNRRVLDILERVTEQQLPRQPSAWWQWWQQQNEYDWPKPTYYVYQSVPRSYYAGMRTSCFLAGTLVRSQMGLVPIESLKVGDRVLAQDQDTGELAYKLVLRTTIRPPSPMTRIKTAGGDIIATLGHPFWVDGEGWKMAKELTVGDLLHSLSGAVRIGNVETAGDQPAYNLVVDGFNTYFVAEQGLLVHDNEFRKPTHAIVPGLVDEGAVSAKK
jgi:hypothetical protein